MASSDGRPQDIKKAALSYRGVENPEALGRWWEHPFMHELEEENRHEVQLAQENDVHCKRQDQVEWAAMRDFNVGAHVTLSQRGGLKEWFASVDADNSGSVSLLELADPLLTTGVAESIEECVEIFKVIDEDGSGEIDFDEFLELVTIKSSGRLCRMRLQWQRAMGKIPTMVSETERRAAIDAAKADGILAICEALKKDEHNSLTLMSAIVFERRKFLSQAVMEDASRYRVRFSKKQFSAIQNLLFSTPEEREAALCHVTEKDAAKARLLTPYKLVSYQRPEPNPKLFRTHKLPWKNDNTEMETQDNHTVVEDQGMSPPWPRRSKVLPRLQKRPIVFRKQAQVGMRSKVSTTALEDQEELYLAMDRARDHGRVDVTADVVVQGANTRLNRIASERAMHRKNMTLFKDWLQHPSY